MYHLINKTKIPTFLLREFIEFCLPKGLKDFSISFYPLNNKKLDYDCYAITDNGISKIVIKIGKCKFPIISNSKDTAYLGYTERRYLKDIYEVLIVGIAHEVRHIWQNTVSKRDFKSGLNQKFSFYHGGPIHEAHYRSEKDATEYACKTLDKYRKICKNL